MKIVTLNPQAQLGKAFRLEAKVGIEPTNAAFAEPCLTTWLLRHPFFHRSDLTPPAQAKQSSSQHSSGSQSFATAVTGVKIVPELHSLFVLLPTKKNFFAANDGRKIQQAALQVFDQNFPPLKFP